MSKPPFTMSKYANELDLQRDARQYYQERAENLERALLDIQVKYTPNGDLSRDIDKAIFTDA